MNKTGLLQLHKLLEKTGGGGKSAFRAMEVSRGVTG